MVSRVAQVVLMDSRAKVEKILRGYSDAELQEIYRSTLSELRIWDDRGVRPFLEMVRDRVGWKLAQ